MGKYTVVVDILGATKELKRENDLLHSLDMFEEGKMRVAYFPCELEINGIPEGDVCETIEELHRERGGYVVFVGIREIAGNKPPQPLNWFMGGIQSVSMTQKGKHGWSLFSDILKQLGYSPEVDEKMRVVAVK